MKVRDLIEELQKLDPDLVVLKQKDDEGNGYSHVYGADSDCFANELDNASEIEIVSDIDRHIEPEFVEGYPIQVCVIY